MKTLEQTYGMQMHWDSKAASSFIHGTGTYQPSGTGAYWPSSPQGPPCGLVPSGRLDAHKDHLWELAVIFPRESR